jgi:transcriptional regulator of acetoin/glycerol metabolism
MQQDDGKTTITQDAPLRVEAIPVATWLLWVYPDPSVPPLRLDPDGEWPLGRDEGCAVVLTGKEISRRHAVIRRIGTSPPELRDLDSRNGIRVNGVPTTSAPLRPGEVVRIGGWIGVIGTQSERFGELAPGLWGGGTLAAALAPLRLAAHSDLPIVLEGETGTGKEMVARAIHGWSGRTGPFLGVNCAALPEALAEGEFFGYRKGAFTGAERASDGLFRGAQGGTLLLDEASDLPMPLQAKLLRVLQEREVRPLGETRSVPVDVRVLVASQHPLIEAVKEGRFRADLLARLNGLTLRLPPLRQRREEVPGLFSRLLGLANGGRVPGLEADLVERLCCHDWPFNVRELSQLVRQLVVLHAGEATLHARHLPEAIGARAPAAAVPPPTAPGGTVTVPMLLGALRAAGGNVTRAAVLLGITRQRAYRLMESNGVDLDAVRGGGEA